MRPDYESELELLRLQTKAAVKAARRHDWPVSEDELKDSLKKAEQAYKDYKQQKKSGPNGLLFDEGRLSLASARSAYDNLALLLATRPEETRACWIDRKTIVSSGPCELAKQIKTLKAAGIDTIYFECNNGGYSHYDSKLLRKNPDLEKWPSWDPLREAIDTAHAEGMKVQAWTKDLSVCNRALDDLLRQAHPDQTFPAEGPVLSVHNGTGSDPLDDWALRMPDGKLPDKGVDLFLDPANSKAREFAQDCMLEIVKQYPDLDGIQYDYIRYPFHNEAMGLNKNSWALFQTRYPQYKDMVMPADPRILSGQAKKDWTEMKVMLIDSFVQDTSEKMLKQNPRLDISAAVYPLDLNETVRQDWAKWLKNGWINTLNPMTYVPHDVTSKDAEFSRDFEKKFRSDIKEIQDASGNRGNILPGIAVARVNPKGVIKEIEVAKQMGTPGETLFASSVLDQKRLKELQLYDARNQFNDFNELLASTWSVSIDSSSRRVHKEIIHQARDAAKSLNKLCSTSAPEEINTMMNQLNTIKTRINDTISKNPAEQNEFTEEFTRRLDSCLSSISSLSDKDLG